MDLQKIAQKRVQQYSNSYSNLPPVNKYSNSNTVTVPPVGEVFASLSDLIAPGDSYMPFYINRYRRLGYRRFVDLANEARRRANKKPAAYLFFWMLKNNELVQITAPVSTAR